MRTIEIDFDAPRAVEGEQRGSTIRRTRRSAACCKLGPAPTEPSSPAGKEAENVRAVWSTLDHVKTRHADVILVHGGGPGTKKIAASWAERHHVHQIVCKPAWDRHGRAAQWEHNRHLSEPGHTQPKKPSHLICPDGTRA